MKKALCIGIDYVKTGGSLQLKGSVNTTLFMRDFLKQQLGYEEVVLLNDRNIECNETPTKEVILRYMSNFASSLKPGDEGFFEIECHGGRVLDTNGEEIDRMDEGFTPADVYKNITDDEIFQSLISQVPKGVRLICIAGTCHSGSLFDLPYTLNQMNFGTL